MLASLVGGALLIALAPILVRMSDVDPVASGLYRVLTAAPLLWVLVAMSPRAEAAVPAKGRDILLLSASGLLLAMDLGLWHISVDMTSVANATAFNNCSPIFVAVALAMMGQAPGRPLLLALAVTTAGMTLMSAGRFSLSSHHVAGDLIAVSTGAFYGGYILLMGRLAPAAFDGRLHGRQHHRRDSGAFRLRAPA
ncbi:EamA family transporter [Alsobacter sp. KACC 23698]|uniref:EamA family transporter n=1 Tax=Alsobacter sp. KACC 23698 TaxID=3149229 RepID=A0AAU7JBV7_9HYPH